MLQIIFKTIDYKNKNFFLKKPNRIARFEFVSIGETKATVK